MTSFADDAIATPCGSRWHDHRRQHVCIMDKGHIQVHRSADGHTWTDAEASADDLIPGGARRVEIGCDMSQLSHIALTLMGETQHEGNGKYGYGNWQKGIPLSNLLTHALKHLICLMNGDTSTETIRQHFGHALWNMEKAAHFAYTRADLIDVQPLKRAMQFNEHGLEPADPNPARSTNCYFCGKSVESSQYKVIPPNNIYRQAHVACFTTAKQSLHTEFNEAPGGK